METQMNPDLDQLKLIIWIGGPILLTLLSVIGYFIKEQLEASKAIATALNALKDVVTQLRVQHEMQHPVIDKRLNSHKEIITDHEKRITILETKQVGRKTIAQERRAKS